MESPPRTEDFTTYMKCSDCETNVPIHLIADHVCSRSQWPCDQYVSIANNPTVTSTPLVEEPEQLRNPDTSSAARPPKPFVPRIDPFAATKPGIHGELTPASSHGSIVASPISPGSGRRSPFLQPPRKVSGPPIRRPPSPELLSQDCAFPPFPTSRQKKRDASRNGSIRGRSRTPDSAASFGHEAKRSASLGAPRFGRRGTADSSIPSTANSSRAGSRKGSVDEIPPLPSLQSTLSHINPIPDLETNDSAHKNAWPGVVELASSDQMSSAHSTAFSSLSPIPSPVQSQTEITLSQSPTNEQRDDDQQQDPKHVVSSHEPSYKAKRPPPILNLPSNIMPSPPPVPDRSPEVPPTPTTPSSSLARTLTGLFSRRRGQSTSSKKSTSKLAATDGPRFIALSPEPDPQDMPRFPNSAHSSLNTEMVMSPPIQDIQEVTQASATTQTTVQRIPEPSQAQISLAEELHEDQPYNEQHVTSPMEEDIERSLTAVVAAPRMSAADDVAEDLKRASIDSASSYGSVGFSNSSSSTRSTNPPYLHSQMSSISTARTASSIGDSLLPPYMRLKAPEIVPDSPTDPYMQYGRLTPVVETPSPGSESGYKENMPPMPAVPDSAHGAFPFPEQARQRRPSTPGACRGTCRGCSRAIMSGQKSVSSKDGRLTGKYHKQCFVCKMCQTPFATADFYVHDDHPYCAHHYHVLNGTLCEGCGKGIEGDYIETSNVSGSGAKKFHPHCLRCATCKIQLSDDYFELSGRVYCERDAFRIVNGPKSPYDTAPSRPSPLNREYISSVEPGQSLAAGRFPERRLTRLMTTY